MIAPAFKANYPSEYGAVLGGLKKLGVNRMMSVSFGADITTWGYLNYIDKYGFTGAILTALSGGCRLYRALFAGTSAEAVSGTEPDDVRGNLCQKADGHYRQIRVFIARVSQKKMEIEDGNNGGYISYNVTFDHLMQYIRKHGISGENADR